MNESKRVRQFRRSLVNAIPKFPNNQETKGTLEAMSLSQLLIHYLNWAYRFISARPRVVELKPEVLNHERWGTWKNAINALLDKVRQGADLSPHLSKRVSSKGYTPTASFIAPNSDHWADKDFLLNVMGYHHFHLGQRIESDGFVTRTDEVIFAHVTREKFTLKGIFDHSVFEPSDTDVSSERKRLWSVFDQHLTQGMAPCSVVIASPIATSGHPIHLVRMGQEYSSLIRQVDSKLDQRAFVAGLYKDAGVDVPKTPKLSWRMNFTDLGIYEKQKQIFFILRHGSN